MALYGTHDTTVAALLCTLGVFDDRWPRFSSNITFELFRDPSAPSGVVNFFLRREKYFIRTRYNNEVVTLPGNQLTSFLFFFVFVGMWGSWDSM